MLTHPTRWPAAAVAALRAATDPLAALAGSLQLVPHAIAAAVAYAADHPVPDGAAVVVCDVGATTDEVFLVRRRGDDLAVLAPPAGPHTGGGDQLDAAVLRLVDDHLNGAAADLDAPPLQTQIAAARLRRDCRAAKEALSTAETVQLTAHLPGGPVAVCAHPRRARPRRPPHHHHDRRRGAGMPAPARRRHTVRAVILTGGSSRLPALHDEIHAASGGRAVHIDPHAAARGAAALGAAELNPHLTHAGEVGGRYGQPAPPDATPSRDPQPTPRRLAPTAHLLAGSDASSWCALHPAPTGLPPLPSPPPDRAVSGLTRNRHTLQRPTNVPCRPWSSCVPLAAERTGSVRTVPTAVLERATSAAAKSSTTLSCSTRTASPVGAQTLGGLALCRPRTGSGSGRWI